MKKDFRLLRISARDADGSIRQYLDVHVLWVREAHRYASKQLNAAEREARQRGCKDAFLDTFSFQAPGFYRKLGYRESGRLDEFSGRDERHFLHKRLDDGHQYSAAPAQSSVRWD